MCPTLCTNYNLNSCCHCILQVICFSLSSGDNNSASTYHSHSVRILSVCPFSHTVQFFPCSWVPRKHGTLEYSCRPEESPFSISVSWHMRTPRAKSATITSQRKNDTITSQHKNDTSQVQFQIAKFKFRQYQNTTSFRHFAKFNACQIFPLYGIFAYVAITA